MIGLVDHSIIYFELDAVGQLQERAKPEMGGGIVGALDLAPVGEGKKGRFLAIGVQIDGVWAVRILSLDAGHACQWPHFYFFDGVWAVSLDAGDLMSLV